LDRLLWWRRISVKSAAGTNKASNAKAARHKKSGINTSGRAEISGIQAPREKKNPKKTNIKETAGITAAGTNTMAPTKGK
jgi:hypothetical protein